MRVLLITDKFLPERGGSQRFLGQLYRHLDGHEVTVVTRDWPGAAGADGAYPHRVVRVPYSRLPRLRSPLLWWRLRQAARRLLATERFDQVHCGQTVETAPWGTRLAAAAGLPALVHTFGEDVTCYLDHPYYRRVMTGALRRAGAVTTVSRFTAGQLASLGVPAERVVLLAPGIEAERWEAAPGVADLRSRWGLAGRRVVLTLGRLIPRKGVDTVLRALPAVRAAVPEVRYLVVGEGPDLPRLRRLAAEAGVADAALFAGGAAEDDLAAVYHAAEVFVMPNRQMPNGDVEGFGQVFLEANACGLPVIAGRSGGALDAVEDGETGYLVEPEDAAQVAERLIHLLRDPEHARRLGEQGRARVRARFTWRQCAEALEGALRPAGGPPR